MNLSAGRTLSHYALVEQIGEGGMGVVWKAEDTVLGRAVALKILPDVFAGDAERLSRFAQEARLLASLNHPNIAAIHGLEEIDGLRFLVLEMVPGDTLADRIARGRLPLGEALDIARQIAEAFEAAHDKGIVHRDLKPANVKLTDEGTIKVLDFGLAKALAGEQQQGSASGASPTYLAHSPTITTDRTRAGSILGTAAYMSPEQARGKPVDKRTDIWAFGCVMYECLTGRQPFPGETVSDVIGAILHLEPDWSLLPENTPPRIARLLRHCLDKDAKRRLRDIGDARLEIEGARQASTSSTPVAGVEQEKEARIRIEPRRVLFGALLLILGAALGLAISGLADRPAAVSAGAGGPPSHLAIPVPAGLEPGQWGLTPDGRRLVLGGVPRSSGSGRAPIPGIYLRNLGDDRFEKLPGTERAEGFLLSPDGRSLAFWAPYSSETSLRKLARIPLDGGSPPLTVADVDQAWGPGIWLTDREILMLFEDGRQFLRLPAGGGHPGPPVDIDSGEFPGRFNFPRRLPRNDAVLVNAITYDGDGYNIGVGVLEVRTGQAKILVEQGGSAAYSPTGHLLFARSETLLAAPFDLERLEVTGEPVAMMGGLRTTAAWAPGDFAVTPQGSLVYPPGGVIGAQRRIMLADAAGEVMPLTEDRRAFEDIPGSFNLAGDGRRIAAVAANPKGVFEIWASGLDRPELRRVVALRGADATSPIWSPDGEWLAFNRTARDENDGIYRQRAGGGPPQLLLKTENPFTTRLYPECWTRDQRTLVFGKSDEGRFSVWKLPLDARGEPAGEPAPLLTGQHDFGRSALSPDDRWFAYLSTEGGVSELYLAAWRSDGSLGAPARITSGVSVGPQWSLDGRTLYYVAGHKQMMSITIDTDGRPTAGEPEVLFDLTGHRIPSPSWNSSILPDGRLIFVQKGEEETDLTHYNVILNWSQQLSERVPSGTP
jgi:serine/threonine-protein kinase